MAGAYVAETLQWRENCLGYMNSWSSERCAFEKLGVKAEGSQYCFRSSPANQEDVRGLI